MTRRTGAEIAQPPAASADEETCVRSHPVVDTQLTHAQAVESVVRVSDLLSPDARRQLEQDQQAQRPVYAGYGYAWMMSGRPCGYDDGDTD
jgi:hypothetical protein